MFETCVVVLHEMIQGKSGGVHKDGLDYSGLGYIIQCFYASTTASEEERLIAHALLLLGIEYATDITSPCFGEYYNPLEYLWVIYITGPLKGTWIHDVDAKLRAKGAIIREEHAPIHKYILTGCL